MLPYGHESIQLCANEQCYERAYARSCACASENLPRPHVEPRQYEITVSFEECNVKNKAGKFSGSSRQHQKLPKPVNSTKSADLDEIQGQLFAQAARARPFRPTAGQTPAPPLFTTDMIFKHAFSIVKTVEEVPLSYEPDPTRLYKGKPVQPIIKMPGQDKKEKRKREKRRLKVSKC